MVLLGLVVGLGGVDAGQEGGVVVQEGRQEGRAGGYESGLA
jgi:hypothetical protein